MKRQISRLNGHRLERLSQNLNFDHQTPSCSVMGDELYLCFNKGNQADYRLCRRSSTGPLGTFSEVTLSNYDHLYAPTSSSSSKFEQVV